ncbi:acyltransferase family protein [Myxococcus sp. 1LA]
MVIGHTLDAVLSPAVRADVWVQHYWTCRGITAPLFLMVAGWAVVAALGSKPTAARDTYGKRVRRALLLIFLGYLVHWPGWSTVIHMGLTEQMLTKVLTFDALQCIGFALLAGATLLAVTPARWGRTVMLVVVAVGLPLVSATMWTMSEGLPGPLKQLIGSGGASRFPFFPWASYFFAGALAANLLGTLRPGVPQGLALVVLGGGLFWFMRGQTQDWGTASAWLVAYRVGQGMMVLGLVNMLPRKASGLLAPLGRLSLWVYVLHLPIVYGWSSYAGLSSRVGPTLSLRPGWALACPCWWAAPCWPASGRGCGTRPGPGGRAPPRWRPAWAAWARAGAEIRGRRGQLRPGFSSVNSASASACGSWGRRATVAPASGSKTPVCGERGTGPCGKGPLMDAWKPPPNAPPPKVVTCTEPSRTLRSREWRMRAEMRRRTGGSRNRSPTTSVMTPGMMSSTPPASTSTPLRMPSSGTWPRAMDSRQ